MWTCSRYDPSPTQETLIRAISISRQWSIHNLYGYAFDHFRRQFQNNQIHPAIVLGVSREYGISDLVEPAVKALARLEIPFSNWSTDPSIIRYTTITDVGTIGRMKEKITMARIALCNPPPVFHDNNTCQHKDRSLCSASWKNFWASTVVPKLINMNGDVENQLWWIRTDCVGKARVMGMMDICNQWTAEEAIGKPAWRAETKIVEGAVESLKVPERYMLDPEDVPEPMS